MKLSDVIKRKPLLYKMAKKLLMKKKHIEIKFFYNLTLKRNFKKRLGYSLNIENPKTFSEKIQWLKLNYKNEKLTKYADKYEVRSIIENHVGSQYLIDIYGVYNSVDEIDIDSLPDQFVFKPNHSAGRVIICEDKNKMNWSKEFKVMREWLKDNFYYETGEWQYKDIPPKIICEKLLEVNITDYKVFCFNGKPQCIQVVSNRDHGNYEVSFYDLDWNLLDINRENHKQIARKIVRPKNFKKMIEISMKISKDFPFVRMDYYEVGDNLFFGETTFTPGNGMMKFSPSYIDEIWGDYLDISELQNNLK